MNNTAISHAINLGLIKQPPRCLDPEQLDYQQLVSWHVSYRPMTMSADSIDQISLRSLRQSSSRNSRRRSVITDSFHEDAQADSHPVEQLAADLDATPDTDSAAGYVDGGYGWVVTAGMPCICFRQANNQAHSLCCFCSSARFTRGVYFKRSWRIRNWATRSF